MAKTYEETLAAFKTKSYEDVNSVTHKFGGDPRLMLASPCALLLQVAHPTVSAGVKEHSDYLQDPWGRLLRTLDFVYVMTYGQPEDMATMGVSIRDIHKSIRGIKRDGTKYSALEPEAYAWVHATLAYFFVKGNEVFGTKMTKAEVDTFWEEWKEIGYLIHVQRNALPETWEGFEAYFNQMIATKLQKTPEIEDLLGVIASPPPPFKIMDGKIWRKGTVPVSELAMLATMGMLPPEARKLFGFNWTWKHELAFKSLVLSMRVATPVVNKITPLTGKVYLKLRRLDINDYYNIGMK